MRISPLIPVILVAAITAFPLSVSASTTDGVISVVNAYAWAENIGWINFGSSQGNVHITSAGMTGYAWGENTGWISLNCSNTGSCSTVDYGVDNNGFGVLTGYAWGENIGWVNFSPTGGGVSIDPSGVFGGWAWGENTGWISFNCSNTNTCSSVSYFISTDYRPDGQGGGGGGPRDTVPPPTPTISVTPSTTPSSTPTTTPSVTPTPSISPTVSPTATATPQPTLSPTPTPTFLPTPSVSPPTSSPPPIQPSNPPGTGGGGTTIIPVPVQQVIQSVVQAASNLGTQLIAIRPIPIPAPVQQTAQKVVELIPGKSETVLIAANVGSATTLVNLFLSNAWIFQSFASLMDYLGFLSFSFFGLITARKKSKTWGIVYDSVNKRPVPFARVELLDVNFEVLDSQITDQDGRYGFLVFPPATRAGEGIEVKLSVAKRGYKFVANKSVDPSASVLYDNIYTGDIIKISKPETITYDVPVVSEMPIAPEPRRAMWLRFNGWLSRLASKGFWIASVGAPLQYFASPNLLNLVILLIFVGMAAMRFFGLKPRPFGITKDFKNVSIPFVILAAYDVFGKKIDGSVADTYGRYFLRVQKGLYTVKAITPTGIENPRSASVKVSTKTGWITDHITL